MITFSNGRKVQYFVASGALAFDGKGWLWERPLVAAGLIKPELFGVVLKSLTHAPRKGNLRWWKPWECVKLIEGGAVNKVGLTNPGFDWWISKVMPKLDFSRDIIVSLFGDQAELTIMATRLNALNLTAVELNVSCPNSGHGLSKTQETIETVKAVKSICIHPLIIKVSYDQDFLAIADGLRGVAEAVSLNSVPWSTVFGDRKSPLWKLERRVAGGGGGVSGKPAQDYNWKAVRKLARQRALPVIAPGIMDQDDLYYVRRLGASAESFGTIHLPDYPVWRQPWTIFTNPCKATKIVERDLDEGFADVLEKLIS